MVETRRDAVDRLNSWALIVIDGFAGMFRCIRGLFFFLLEVDMVVLGE